MATPNLSFQNYFTTTLATGITASDSTIYLNSLPTGSEGYLVIEPDSSTNKEIIYYTSKGANFVTLPSVAAGRGVGGTSAVSHSSGVTCQMNVVAEHFKALQDGTAFAVGGIGASAYADGWTPILGSTPNTVTYNGNRNYDLVFNSVDLSSTISAGQRLKLTRTVAAPTKCTDLELSSSQYYSKTSPTGLSFTTTFTCMAWIKVESYGADMGIIARRNADTEGFSFAVDTNGRLNLIGLRIAGNNKAITSYASVPLNKWVHVAATLDMSAGDTTAQKIWIDGVETPRSYTLNGTATALVQGTTALVVGAQKSAGTNPFDGKIAQAAVFSSQLTEANVRAYQTQGLAGSESNLVSAYSFNNSITDLNTTNANNLTAQGSAVATDTDSPFANAVSAGLQEYGLVQSVSYSTNTTVNVQVPEGCAIPTSGGVSNVYYSVGRVPYGFVSDRGRWRITSNYLTRANKASPASGTAYSLGAEQLSIPTGAWLVSYRMVGYTSSTTGVTETTKLDLISGATTGPWPSTTGASSNAKSDFNTTLYSASPSEISGSMFAEGSISNSSLTVYSVTVVGVSTGTLSNINLLHDYSKGIIMAEPAGL
jgi:hypothetical protein